MELSVVVPTLNSRARLVECLDALAEHAPEAEVIVVNGPSTDGTTGAVRERDDVDVLLEVSDRNLNVARNAGIDAARGDAIALVSERSAVEASWAAGTTEALAGDAAVATGPVHREVRGGLTTESLERRAIGGREVTFFDGGNVAFDRAAIEALDGFDEYLLTGGARDVAHRLAGRGHGVEWNPDVCVVRRDDEEGSDYDRDWGWKYRALAYRLVKNYGPRPGVLRRTFTHAGADGFAVAKGMATGEVVPSHWFGCGRDVLANIAIGTKDGMLAWGRDRTPTRNPNGLSTRADRAVERYDWR